MNINIRSSLEYIADVEDIIESLGDNGQETLNVGSDEEVASSDAESIRYSIADWATKYSISLVALSALLVILQNLKLDVPKDARTLLKTPVYKSVLQKAGGLFYYSGIKSSISLFVKMRNIVIAQSQNILSLQISVDGIALFKSSNTQLSPIIGMIKEFRKFGLFVIASFVVQANQILRQTIYINF